MVGSYSSPHFIWISIFVSTTARLPSVICCKFGSHSVIAAIALFLSTLFTTKVIEGGTIVFFVASLICLQHVRALIISFRPRHPKMIGSTSLLRSSKLASATAVAVVHQQKMISASSLMEASLRLNNTPNRIRRAKRTRKCSKRARTRKCQPPPTRRKTSLPQQITHHDDRHNSSTLLHQ